MSEYIKKYLLPAYKFIIEYFAINKFKAYRKFVKFTWHIDNNPHLVSFWTIIVFMQFAIWHWVYDNNLFDDIITMCIAYLLYKFVFSKLMK